MREHRTFAGGAISGASGFLEARLHAGRNLFFAQGIARDVITLLVGNGIARVFSLLFSLLVARALGPAEYGIVTVCLSIILWLPSLTRLGMQEGIVRLVASDMVVGDSNSANLVIKVGLKTRLAVCALVLAAGVAISDTLAVRVLNTPHAAPFLRMSFAAAAGLSAFDLMLGNLQGLNRFASYAALQAGLSLAKFIFVLAIVWLVGELTITETLLPWLVFPLAAAIIGLRMLPKGFTRATGDEMKVLRYLVFVGKWMLVSGLAWLLLGNADVFFLMHYASSTATGLYGASMTLALGMAFLKNAFSLVLLPHVSTLKNAGQLKSYVKQVLHLGLPGAGLFLMVIVISLPWVIPALYGSSYAAAVPVARVLFTAFTVDVIALPLAITFFALEEPRFIAFQDLVRLFMGLGGYVLLIPAHGAIGAAWAVMVSNMAAAAFTVVGLRVVLGRPNTGLGRAPG